jgi:hypothetical protein
MPEKLDSCGNVDTKYFGTECIVFDGASKEPDGTGGTNLSACSCPRGGPIFTLVSDLAAANDAAITRHDALTLWLAVTDPLSETTGPVKRMSLRQAWSA